MIYRYAMETNTNVVQVRQWVVRPAEYDKNHMKSAPSLALLAVNRQVNSEAMMVLKELKTCNVAGDFLTNMRAHHRLALKLFARFSVQVTVPYDRLDPSSTSELHKLFYKVVSAMIKGRKKVERQARFMVNIQFANPSRFTPTYLRVGDFRDARRGITGEQAYMDLWSKAALEDKVASWQAELSKKLPKATMTTNADLKYYGIEYQMKGEVLFFVDKEHQRLGKVKYKGSTSKLAVEFLPFENAENFIPKN